MDLLNHAHFESNMLSVGIMLAQSPFLSFSHYITAALVSLFWVAFEKVWVRVFPVPHETQQEGNNEIVSLG